MAGIRDDLELDTTAALDAIAALGGALTDAIAGAGDALATSIATAADAFGSIDLTVTPQIDAGQAVDTFTGDFQAAADVLQQQVADALDAGVATFPADQLQSEAADALQSGVEAGLATTPDVSALTDALSAGVEQGIADGADAGTSAAEGSFASLGDAADSAGSKVSGASSSGEAGLKGLDLAAAAAAGNIGAVGSNLQSLAPGIAVAAGIGGALFETAKQAEGLRTAEERLNIIFGDQAGAVQKVNVGGLVGGLRDLTVQAGGSVPAMLQATASIGQFGQSAGASRSQITGTTSEIQALALRAVALNPALGDAGDVADRLTRVLASGRARGLIPFGLSIDQVAAKTLAGTIAFANGRTEVTRFDLASASAQLAVMGLGNTIGTSFATGVQQTGVQLKALRAQLEDTIATAGQPILGPLIDDAKALLPVAEALGVSLAEVLRVISLIPAPVIAAAAAAAAFGFGIHALIGLLTTLVGSVLAKIPLETTQAAAGFLGVGAAAEESGAEVAAGMAAATSGISIVIAALAAAAVGFGLFGSGADDSAAKAKALGEALLGVDTSSGAAASGIVDLTKAFTDALSKGDLGRLGDQLTANKDKLLNAFTDAGFGATQFASALTAGHAGVAAFTAAVLKVNPPTALIAKTLAGAGVTQKQWTDAIRQGGGALDDLIQKVQLSDKATTDGMDATQSWADRVHGLVAAFRDAQSAESDQARAQLDLLNTEGKLNDKEKARLKSGGDLIPLYIEVTNRVNAQTQAQADSIAKIDENTFSWNNLSSAIIKAGGSIETIPDIAGSSKLDPKAIDAFAKSVSDALASVTKDAASALPATGDAIKSFVDDINKAASNLETAASATHKNSTEIKADFKALADATNPAVIIKNLDAQRTSILNFTTNVQRLFASGNVRAAQEALKLGPEVGGQMAASLIKGGPQIESAANTALLGVDRAQQNLLDQVNKKWGPEIAGAFGVAAKNADGSFSFELNSGSSASKAVDTALGSAVKAFGAGSPQFVAQAQTLGLSTSEAFQAALNLGGPATTAIARIPALITEFQPSITLAAASVSADLTNNFNGNVAKVPFATQVAFAQAVQGILAAQPGLSTAAVSSAVTLARGFGEELTGGQGIPAKGTAAYALLVTRLQQATPGLSLAAAATAITAAGAFTKGLDGGLAAVEPHIGATLSLGIARAESRESDFANTGKNTAKALGDALSTQLGTSIAAAADQAKAGGGLIGASLGLAVADELSQQTVPVADATSSVVKIAANNSRGVAGEGGRSIGDASAAGIIEGLNGRKADIENTFAQMILDAEAAAKRQAGIHSPSTLFAEIGKQLAAGLAQGVAGATSLPVAQVEKLVDTLANTAAAQTAAAVQGVSDRLLQTIGVGATTALNTSVARAEAAANATIDRTAGTIVNDLGKAVTSLGAQQRAGLTTGAVSLTDVVAQIGDPIAAAIAAEHAAISDDFTKGVGVPVAKAISDFVTFSRAFLQFATHSGASIAAVTPSAPRAPTVATPTGTAVATQPIAGASALTIPNLVVQVTVQASPGTTTQQAAAIGTAAGNAAGAAAADTLARRGIVAAVRAG